MAGARASVARRTVLGATRLAVRALRRAEQWAGAGDRPPPSPAPQRVFSPLDVAGTGSYLAGAADVRAAIVRIPGEQTRVTIGSYCSFASGVQIFAGSEHRPDWVSTFPFRVVLGLDGAHEDGHPASRGDTTIGNDVWIGTNALVTSGVSIGDGAVIGAGAVVTRDVPPYRVVAGVPARELRARFSDRVIAELLRIRWWNWDAARVEAHIGWLCSPDVEAFVDAHAEGADCALCPPPPAVAPTSA